MVSRLLFILALMVASCMPERKEDLTEYVNPFVGTDAYGNTYPGATVPFGMVQLSPDTRLPGFGTPSGYHFSDTVIYGFSHTHLSGTGGSDLCDILLVPTQDEPILTSGFEEHATKSYSTTFKKKNEKASPGYYAVKLDNGIDVELTTSQRVGFHRYSFTSNKANVVIDLNAHFKDDIVTESSLKIINNRRIEGHRVSDAWAKGQHIYFAIEFDQPFVSQILSDADKYFEHQNSLSGKDLSACFSFDLKGRNVLLCKIALSTVSAEGAWKNLEGEIPHWDFDLVLNSAKDQWNSCLAKITVKGKSQSDKKNFYTALYHSLICPIIINDIDGKYRGMDNNIHQDKEKNHYSIFSLWDTYRALHPLLTLIEPERTLDMVHSLLAKYDQSGLLPVWELYGYETNTMIGYHSVPVIVDAYVKGVTGFDKHKALEAMKKSAEQNAIGLPYYRDFGYIPFDKETESVSKTLEYAYDDWCIAYFALLNGDSTTANQYFERSQYYINLFDTKTNFMRPKDSQGYWKDPFNPFEFTSDYTEANAWQYTLYVPHDIQGLINIMGGESVLRNWLDSLFNTAKKLHNDHWGIEGLIGQYAHGNEPSHHLAYLYNYTSTPWETQRLIRHILKNFYHCKPDGLCGNDDCGQMSAWYVFSAMGIYPVCPGTEYYVIGSPLFEECSINLTNGKTFKIIAENLSDKSIYVQQAWLNDQQWNKGYITHNDIVKGGTLRLKMGKKPSTKWGNNPDFMYPPIFKKNMVAVPYIKKGITYFIDSSAVMVESITPGAVLKFTEDGTEPTENSKVLPNPIIVKSSKTIKIKAFKEGHYPSKTLTVPFKKLSVLKAIHNPKLQQGIRYKYYEGNMNNLSEMYSLTPKEVGIMQGLNTKAKCEDFFGFDYNGYIYIPKTGVYTFYIASDDGSKLFINNKLIVDNDGRHGVIEKKETIALEKGFHPFNLGFFDAIYGHSLIFSWKYEDGEKELVPDDVLFH